MNTFDEIYIHHHLGLGDHIICNGLVREICKIYSKVYLFCKPHNLNNVKFMYRDLENLEVLEGDDRESIQYIMNNNLRGKYLRIGHENIIHSVNFDESFYKQLNISFEKRWSSFYVERDLIKEQKTFDELNPNNEDFVIIHNEDSNGVDRIDYSQIDPNLKKIYTNKEYDFFSFITLFESAKEIHCIDSSFIHLVNSLNLSNKKIFHKNYKSRNYNFTLQGEWIEI